MGKREVGESEQERDGIIRKRGQAIAAKECEQCLEPGESKEIDSSLEPPERNASLQVP